MVVDNELEKALSGENSIIRNQIEVIKKNYGRKYPMKLSKDQDTLW